MAMLFLTTTDESGGSEIAVLRPGSVPLDSCFGISTYNHILRVESVSGHVE